MREMVKEEAKAKLGVSPRAKVGNGAAGED